MNTILKKIDKDNIDYSVMEMAGEILRRGEMVAFPTETVYGLGANALDESASAKIYEDKKTSVGLNVGGGIDFIINDYFIIGAEYSYSKNKNKTFTIDGHRISLKFGAQFF